MIENKEHIEAAKNGCQHAMHHLYALYAKAMLNTSFRIMNNREDAEDVLQDSFVKVFSNLHQFKYQSTFGAWIKRIVVNRSIDLLKQKKKKFLFQELSPTIEKKLSINVEIQEDTQWQLDKVYEALHQLPDGYRAIFSLYMLDGYDHNEISKILQIGVSTSISQLSRAKKKLKSIIFNNSIHG